MSDLNARQAARRARHYAKDEALLAEYPTHRAEVAATNRERDQANLARGLALPAADYADFAGWVDEPTWLRILGEHQDTQPDRYAELLAIRAPAERKPQEPRTT